jgi:hypothetical protein
MLSSKTIPVNILSNVEIQSEFNSNVDMATKSPSHRPRADIFQLWSVFFETPQAIGPYSSMALIVHA